MKTEDSKILLTVIFVLIFGLCMYTGLNNIGEEYAPVVESEEMEEGEVVGKEYGTPINKLMTVVVGILIIALVMIYLGLVVYGLDKPTK